MKKTILTILLYGTLILGLTGCGSSIKAKITDNNEKQIETTANELLNIYNENSAKFEKNYMDATIELEGIVEKVSSNMGGWIYDIVYLEDDWEILFSKGYYDLSNLEKGTKVHIKSKIAGKDPENHSDKIAIYGIRKNNDANVIFEIIK